MEVSNYKHFLHVSYEPPIQDIQAKVATPLEQATAQAAIFAAHLIFNHPLQ